MSVQTFEEACAAAQQEHPEVVKIKQAFVKPLAELKELRTQWDKQRSELQKRFEAVQSRVRRAIACGVDSDSCTRLLGNALTDLMGANIKQGIIEFLGGQISTAIAKMERFDQGQFELAESTGSTEWKKWPSEPGRVRDNVAWAERCMRMMEEVVKDGGPLHHLVERVAESKAGTQAVA